MAGDFTGPGSNVTYKFLAADTKKSIIEFTENRTLDSLGIGGLTVRGIIDGDLLADTENLEFSQGGFSVFPNPAQQFVTIEDKDFNSDIIELTLFDMQGRVVANHKEYLLGQNLDVQTLATGIYLIQIRDKDKLYTDRLMIKRD